MTLGRPPAAITVARVRAVDITLNWRWLPVLVLGTWLLARTILPLRFPDWDDGTLWMTSAAAVIGGELALLLHELSHAVLARGRGVQVTRIVFHGFRAHTVVVPKAAQPPNHEALIALAGPAMNVVLGAIALLLHFDLAARGPVDAFLLMLAIGNVASAVASLVPIGDSDGARAFSAFRRSTSASPSRAHLAAASCAGPAPARDTGLQRSAPATTRAFRGGSAPAIASGLRGSAPTMTSAFRGDSSRGGSR